MPIGMLFIWHWNQVNIMPYFGVWMKNSDPYENIIPQVSVRIL